MIFTMPLGLLALLAIPAIIVIHLFRRRFPVRPTAGLFLWETTRQAPEGGGVISKLPVTASLFLECLAALALALILAGARIRPDSLNNHLVVLLDDSASMAAVNAAGESARNRAVRRFLNEVERLGSGGRFTLIQSGERPSVLSGPASFAVEARSAIDKWKPGSRHHSHDLGLRLARELGGKTGRVLVLTDAPHDTHLTRDELEGVVWASVGESLDNVGVTAAQRIATPGDGKAAVLLTLANFSDTAAKRQLHILAGDREVLKQDLDLPKGTSSLNLPVAPGLPPMHISLSADALARDNEVTLVEPRPRIVGVDNRLPEGRGRQALVKALSAVGGVTQTDSPHLSFQSASELDRPFSPGVWRAGFGEPPQSMRAAGDPQDFVGPFVPEKRHPFLDGVTLAGVVWSSSFPLNRSILHPLVSAGDQALIAVVTDGWNADSTILFNLDLERTNLIRSPDWPILISNIIENRRQSLPGPERWNYHVGEWVRIRLGREPKARLHYRSGGTEHELPRASLLEFAAPSPGGLLQVMEGDDAIYELGVNFLDEEESNLRDRLASEDGTFDANPAGLKTESGAASDPLFWILLAVGGLSMLANWCLPQTVRSSGE